MNVDELVPRNKVEILDLNETTEEERMKDALKWHFGENRNGIVKVSSPFAVLNEELVSRLLQTRHIEVGWVSSRVRKKAKVIRSYPWQFCGHLS